MMNVHKPAVRIGALGLACLALVLAAVAAFHRHEAAVPTPVKAPSRQAPVAGTVVPPPVLSPAAAPSAPPVVAVTFAPLPADATTIPDDYLLKLAGLVNLANARNETPDKTRWEQATAAAERLQMGPCDCEQRNWLHHFVAMGNAVRSDDKFQYYELADLMRTLGRNDAQAMALSRKGN